MDQESACTAQEPEDQAAPQEARLVAVEIIQADVLEWASREPKILYHAALMDPPYHLGPSGFMNKAWDSEKYGIAFRPETWAALARHLLPGAFLFVFASSRGWHRLACALEDAGLIMHPSIYCWVQAAGFPKATRIDKDASPDGEGNRETRNAFGGGLSNRCVICGKPFFSGNPCVCPRPKSDSPFAGHRYGRQAMKPAAEMILLFQKPYLEKPVESIVKHGAGALNIDAGRIGAQGDKLNGGGGGSRAEGWARPWQTDHHSQVEFASRKKDSVETAERLGRWPANFVLVHTPECRQVGTKRVASDAHHTHKREIGGQGIYGGGGNDGQDFGNKFADADGLETVAAWECADGCPVDRLDAATSGLHSAGYATQDAPKGQSGIFGSAKEGGGTRVGDAGGASRFFHQSDWNAEVEERIALADPVRYQSKASQAERNAGLDGVPEQGGGLRVGKNPHPT